jgi:hypothetical protein
VSKIERKKLAKGTKITAQQVNDFIVDIVDDVNTPTIDNNNLPYKSNFDLTFNTRILKNNKTLGKGWTVYGSYNSTTGVATPHAGDMGSPRKLATLVDNGYPEQYVYQHFHFILPNGQDVFNINGLTKNSYVYSLDRVTVGVDTLDNPAATHPSINTAAPNPVGTYHSLSGTDAMDITVSLYRKTVFKNSATLFWEEKVGEWNIPGTAFLNAGLDTNPLAFDDLKIKIFPDSVYLLAITSNNTEDTLQIEYTTTEPQTLIINNLQINLGFSCRLLNFDTVTISTDVPSIQNAPYSDQLSPYLLSNTATNTVINPGDQITETRVQGNLNNIDIPIVRKLEGGYETDSSAPHHRQIQTSACYETKQIPIMNNNNMLYGWSKQRIDNADSWKLFSNSPGLKGRALYLYPYTSIIPQKIDWITYQADETVYQIADRKYLPIHEPFSIHHMMFTYWVGNPAVLNGDRPVSAGTYFELQVFLHTLDRSDSVIRQQIGYAKWRPNDGVDIFTGQNLLVDKALWLEQQNSPVTKWSSTLNPCGFTIQIPINYGTTTPKQGVGYTKTGKPFFYGQGYYPYSAYGSRTSYFRGINDDTLVQYTNGHEQFIEVIFKISNAQGLGSGHPFTTQGVPPAGEPNYVVTWEETGTILQQPGAMFYLLGKKSLIDSRGNH